MQGPRRAVFRDFSGTLSFPLSLVGCWWLQNTLRDFLSFKFVKVYFISQDVISLGICSMGNRKSSKFCYSEVERAINTCYILLVEDFVELSSILPNFIPSCYINC